MTRPVALMGPHAAAMGVKFYTGKMFPAEYQNTMFIVRKGSWNRAKPFGFDVVNVRVGEDGKATIQAVRHRLPGGRRRLQVLGPPGVRRSRCPTARCCVSDEQTGAIYRISYQRPKAAAKKEAPSSALRAPQGAVGLAGSPPFFHPLAFAQERVQLCAACHGADGNSVDPKVPSIAGQPKLFLETQLVLFREELRKSDLMLPVVKGLKDPQLSRSPSISRSCRRRAWRAGLRTRPS